VVELTFHRKIKPVAGDYQMLRMMHDQANPVQPIMRYIAALPEKPISVRSTVENLTGLQHQHWINGLNHQYNKNENMIGVSQPILRSEIPTYVTVFNSVITCQIKEKGTDLYKFEA